MNANTHQQYSTPEGPSPMHRVAWANNASSQGATPSQEEGELSHAENRSFLFFLFFPLFLVLCLCLTLSGNSRCCCVGVS